MTNRVITPEKRLEYSIAGWPKPTDSERCLALTLQGTRCAHRRAPISETCQQHQRRIERRCGRCHVLEAMRFLFQCRALLHRGSKTGMFFFEFSGVCYDEANTIDEAALLAYRELNRG